MRGRAWRRRARAPSGARRPVASLALTIVLVLVMAAGASCDEGSPTGNSAVSEDDSGEEEGESAGAEIETSAGTFVIDEVEVADRWPPDCGDLGPGCSEAEAGYKVLVVWLEAPGRAAGDISGELTSMYSDVSVTDSQGERTNGFAGGLASGRLLIAFTPPETSSGFTLHWPDNDPIELDV